MTPGRLAVMGIRDAVNAQYRLVDTVCRVFSGRPLLAGADLGVREGTGPEFTALVQKVIAEYFEAGDSILVQGAGTGALREALAVTLPPGGRVLCHFPGPYHTTRATLDAMGAKLVQVDFGNVDALEAGLGAVDAVLVQHTRQLATDHYDAAQVISTIRNAHRGLPVVVDDNYAALKVPRIGSQLGADLSAFSVFKLLGPEGIGCVVGKAELISRIRERGQSGGQMVQGPTARAVLEGLVHAPVLLALQDEAAEAAAERLNHGEVSGVIRASVANLPETDILVELERPIGRAVVETAPRFGASNYPVAAEAVSELVPLIYKPSKLMLALDPSLGDRLLRVNPLRAGPDTIVRVLDQCIRYVEAQENRSDRGIDQP